MIALLTAAAIVVPGGSPPAPAPLEPPMILAPAPREVSFGRVSGLAPLGSRVVVVVGGKRVGTAAVRARRFDVSVPLPAREATVRVTALDGMGGRASRAVRRVRGLPEKAEAAEAPPAAGFEDPVLARTVRGLARAFPGTAAVFVQDLKTGDGAAWNARARFPGASTLKLPIAIAVLRELERKPKLGSRIDRLLHDMLVYSDNAAANELETWLGGSVAGGAARVNETMAAIGLHDSRLYGGFVVPASLGAPPIPLRVESQPRFGVEKYTTAWDLARVHRSLHLAAAGRGPLLRSLPGKFTAGDARYLLYLLARSTDRGRLDRFLARGAVTVANKAGWVEHARHDAGVVYWRRGAFVVVVLTWSGTRVGSSADVLAGRVAQVALARFREPRATHASLPKPLV